MVRFEDGADAPEPWVVGPITRTDFVRYQGASGDMNPIHHDEPFAKRAGFDAPLGVGMFHAGVMNSWAVAWLGAENVRRTRVRWKAPVWPDDVLTIAGKVLKSYTEDGTTKVDVEVCCTKHDGTVAAQSWLTFVVP